MPLLFYLWLEGWMQRANCSTDLWFSYNKLAHPQIFIYIGVLEPIPQQYRRKTKFWGSHEFYVGLWPCRSGSWRAPLTAPPSRLFQVQLYWIEEQAMIIQQLSVALESMPVLKFSSVHFIRFYHRSLHSHKIGLDFILNIVF